MTAWGSAIEQAYSQLALSTNAILPYVRLFIAFAHIILALFAFWEFVARDWAVRQLEIIQETMRRWGALLGALRNLLWVLRRRFRGSKYFRARLRYWLERQTYSQEDADRFSALAADGTAIIFGLLFGVMFTIGQLVSDFWAANPSIDLMMHSPCVLQVIFLWALALCCLFVLLPNWIFSSVLRYGSHSAWAFVEAFGGRFYDAFFGLCISGNLAYSFVYHGRTNIAIIYSSLAFTFVAVLYVAALASWYMRVKTPKPGTRVEGART